MILLDGKAVSEKILNIVASEVTMLKQGDILPKLVVLLVGENPASLSYIKQKRKSCEKTGILWEQIDFNESVTQEELIDTIHKLNERSDVHGILVQLPLPKHIFVPDVIRSISPRKDVDGFHAYNVGKMFLGAEFEELAPCTPKGVITLLDEYAINVEGLHAVVVGASNIVGKPMSVMLTNRNATVTTCNIFTKNLSEHTRRADLIVSAVGKPGLITEDMVKENVIVIDVGCTKVNDTLYGDVDFNNVAKKASYITPVPGGIGPMTVALLMENTVKACKHLQNDPHPLVIS